MNINFFDTSFYDKESGNYSEKRYLTVPNTYNKFFFQRRLKLLINKIDKYINNKSDLVIIEDGCADGFVIRTLVSKFKKNISKAIGVDISPLMIDKAKKSELENLLSFSVKDELNKDIKANILLAIGFVSPGIFEEEFDFIKSHTDNNSLIILSLVSNNSLFAKLKLKNMEILKDYWDYKSYENLLKNDFEILDSISYGLFVPKLWSLPRIAMLLQPIFEIIFGIFPNLFHERFYFLKKRR